MDQSLLGLTIAPTLTTINQPTFTVTSNGTDLLQHASTNHFTINQPLILLNISHQINQPFTILPCLTINQPNIS